MPQVIRHIPLANIRADHIPLGPRTLAIVDHLRAGHSVPPIKLVPDGKGNYDIKDGRHRNAAYKLLGRRTALSRFGVRI